MEGSKRKKIVKRREEEEEEEKQEGSVIICPSYMVSVMNEKNEKKKKFPHFHIIAWKRKHTGWTHPQKYHLRLELHVAFPVTISLSSPASLHLLLGSRQSPSVASQGCGGAQRTPSPPPTPTPILPADANISNFRAISYVYKPKIKVNERNLNYKYIKISTVAKLWFYNYVIPCFLRHKVGQDYGNAHDTTKDTTPGLLWLRQS